MIRDYFSRLVGEVEEHPHVPVTVTTDEAKKARRDHDSAQRDALGRMKQFASWFTHGVPNGAHLRRAIFEAKKADDVVAEVDRFFEARLNSPIMDQTDAENGREELLAAPATWG
ncbi:MAG: hypothetical protein INR62_09065 [Rhodospirillales bacterium]|nr:hypothetical protein [Acetobacter sp.]